LAIFLINWQTQLIALLNYPALLDNLHCRFVTILYDNILNEVIHNFFLLTSVILGQGHSKSKLFVRGFWPTIPRKIINIWSLVLSNPVNRQTDRQTDRGEYIIAFSAITIWRGFYQIYADFMDSFWSFLYFTDCWQS